MGLQREIKQYLESHSIKIQYQNGLIFGNNNINNYFCVIKIHFCRKILI